MLEESLPRTRRKFGFFLFYAEYGAKRRILSIFLLKDTSGTALLIRCFM